MPRSLKINDYRIKFYYCRVLSNFDYLDYSYSIYKNENIHVSNIYIWIDKNEKIIEIKSGYWHCEPLTKDIVELLISYLGLEKYTLNIY